MRYQTALHSDPALINARLPPIKRFSNRGIAGISGRLLIFPAPDIVASATEMPMVADGSVDAVWSQRALDNLAPREMPRALAEFRRVLDKDGFALLALAEPHIAAATLRAALIEAGFEHVETWETASELWAKAHKSVPAADIGAWRRH